MTPAAPTTQPAAEATESAASRSLINHTQLASLTKTKEICRTALVELATESRLWLQFAANAEWLHTNPANTPIRREFQLPITQPYAG